MKKIYSILLYLILLQLAALSTPVVNNSSADQLQETRKRVIREKISELFHAYDETHFIKQKWVTIGREDMYRNRLNDEGVDVYIDPAYLDSLDPPADASYTDRYHSTALDGKIGNPLWAKYKEDVIIRREPFTLDPYLLWHEMMHAVSHKNKLDKKSWKTYKGPDDEKTDHLFTNWAINCYKGLGSLAEFEKLLLAADKNNPTDQQISEVQRKWSDFVGKCSSTTYDLFPNEKQRQEMQEKFHFKVDPRKIMENYMKMGYRDVFFSEPVILSFDNNNRTLNETVAPGEPVTIRIRLRDISESGAPQEGEVVFQYYLFGTWVDIGRTISCPCDRNISVIWTPESDPLTTRTFKVRVQYQYGLKSYLWGEDRWLVPSTITGTVTVTPFKRKTKLIIKDKQSGKGVGNATIKIKNTSLLKSSSLAGEALFEEMEPGLYEVAIEAKHYERRVISINVPAVKTLAEAEVPKFVIIELEKQSERLEIRPNAVQLDSVGKTTTLKVYKIFADKSEKLMGSGLSWQSNDPHIASVNASGEITAQSSGSTIIFVDGEGLQADCPVTVTVAEQRPQIGILILPEEKRSYPVGTTLTFKEDTWRKNPNNKYSFAWYVDGEKVSGDSSFIHTFNQPGSHYVMLDLFSSDPSENDTIRTNINIEYPEDETCDFSYDPPIGKANYVAGDMVTFRQQCANLQGNTDFRWYVNDVESGRGEIFTHTFAEQGTYTIRLGLRMGSNFDQIKCSKSITIGSSGIGTLDPWVNRFKAKGGKENLSVCSEYYVAGKGAWSPTCTTTRTIGSVDGYGLCTGEQSGGWNTGFLVYAKKGKLNFEVYHFKFDRWVGNVHYSGVIPKAQNPDPDSINISCRANVADVSWANEDGSQCSTKIWKFSHSGMLANYGIEQPTCTQSTVDSKKLKQCKKFAKRAVEQYDENIYRNCNLEGPEWHGDEERHKQWCLSVPEKDSTDLNTFRDNALSSCGKTWCNAYATRAVAQNEENLSNNCGFSGRSWQSIYENHYNWCRDSSKSAADSATRDRDKKLRSCLSGREGPCREYAEKAVAQNEQNLRKDCGYCGERWQSSYESHFQWCIKQPQSMRDSETKAREKLIGKCEDVSSSGTRTFYEPCYNDYRLDNCLTFGTDCERPVADKYCREKGFAKSSKWKREYARPTYIIDDNRVCDAEYCVGFEYITCTGYQYPDNKDPVCTIKRPKSGQVFRPGQSVGFSADASDPDYKGHRSDNLNYAWIFDGGRPDKHESWQGSATSRWNAPGTYSATLIVTDKNGGKCTDTVAVTIQDKGGTFDCDQYADKSVRQNEENISKNCGFTGELWHSSKSGHTNWCLNAGQESAVRNIGDREKALSRCAGTTTTTSLTCAITEPVEIAFPNAGQSVTFAFNAQGPSVSSLKYNWKFGEYGAEPGASTKQNPGKVTFKWVGSYTTTLTVTDSSGQTCQDTRHVLVYDSNEPREFCEGYAGIAIEQNEVNKKNKCALSGEHWHNDELKHQEWCKSVSVDQAKNELRKRDQEIRQCAGANITPPPQNQKEPPANGNSIPQTEGSFTLKPLYGVYAWEKTSGLSLPGNGAVVFEAKATNDIHVSFAQTASDKSPLYEVVIGGWGNTQSVIRKGKQTPHHGHVRVKGHKNPKAMVVSGQWASYWVSVNNGLVKVGRGSSVGENTFMEWQDSEPLTGLQRVAFSSWNTQVEIKNIRIQAVGSQQQNMPPAANAYQQYISAYNALTSLMAEGKGDTPEAQEAYKQYKYYKDLYEQQLKTGVKLPPEEPITNEPVADSGRQGGIIVESATYGGNCGVESGNVTQHIAEQCNGKSTCRYTVNHKVIGDPVYGCAKNYIVRYRCNDDPRIFEESLTPEAGWGDKSVFLKCSGISTHGAATISGNMSLPPIADSHVYAYSYLDWNKANWGQYGALGAGWNPIGGEKRAYLKFDLTGIDAGKLKTATLKLYHYHTGGGNSVTLGVHQVVTPWVEGRGTYKPATKAEPNEITWVNQPSFDPVPVVQFKPGPGTNKWIEVDITPLVRKWLAGTPNHGLVIKAQGNLGRQIPESQYGFYARESKEEAKMPILEISSGSGTSTLPFFDDFNSGSGKWHVTGNSAVVQEGKLYWNTGSFLFAQLQQDVTMENIAIEFDGYTESNGINVYLQNESDEGYLFILGGWHNTQSGSDVGKAGQNRELVAGKVWNVKQWHHYKVVRQGDLIEAYCDGRLIFKRTVAPKYSGSGKLKFDSWNSRIGIDNVSVYRVN